MQSKCHATISAKWGKKLDVFKDTQCMAHQVTTGIVSLRWHKDVIGLPDLKGMLIAIHSSFSGSFCHTVVVTAGLASGCDCLFLLPSPNWMEVLHIRWSLMRVPSTTHSPSHSLSLSLSLSLSMKLSTSMNPSVVISLMMICVAVVMCLGHGCGPGRDAVSPHLVIDTELNQG